MRPAVNAELNFPANGCRLPSSLVQWTIMTKLRLAIAAILPTVFVAIPATRTMCAPASSPQANAPSPPTTRSLCVVAFGDSTTAPRTFRSAPLRVYAAQLRARLHRLGYRGPVINRGLPGSHSGRRSGNDRHKIAHATDRFAPAVLEEDPDLVIIQFGINDSWVDAKTNTRPSRIPLERYRKNLTVFVDRLQQSGVAVILMTPNPLGDRYERWRQHVLYRYVQAAREVARAKKVPLVDAWAIFHRTAKRNQMSISDLLIDGMHPGNDGHQVLTEQLVQRIQQLDLRGSLPHKSGRSPIRYSIPIVDVTRDTHRQVTVDRQKRTYLGHPTTVLLEDGLTILTVYPKGHGGGAIVMKRSRDGGKTWSERLPVPDNWRTSQEVPTIHRVVDAAGKKRLIVFSGLHPARMAMSEDDGKTWTPLAALGDWGGIVVMGCVVKKSKPGHYLAMFHDDGRFFRKGGAKTYRATRKAKRPVVMTTYQTSSTDGGLTWSQPRAVFASSDVHLCEPGAIRSPDGKTLAILLRENRRKRNSHVMFSNDDGQTFTAPRELPAALTGDRHTARYVSDGRLFVSFRDTCLSSPTQGDWVAWVGTFADIVAGREGQYRVRLMDNRHKWDCAYPGVECLPDDTIVTTTYGHWTKGQKPYIVSIRLRLSELDQRVRR